MSKALGTHLVMTRSSSTNLAGIAFVTLVTLGLGALACGQVASIGSDKSGNSALSPNDEPGEPGDASLDPEPTPTDAAAPPMMVDASPALQGSLTCSANDGTTLTYDRSCLNGPSECAIGYIAVDCCGTVAAYGINVAEQSRFDESAKTCGPANVCDCAPKMARAEDGETSLYADHHDVQVGCVDLHCVTYIAK